MSNAQINERAFSIELYGGKSLLSGEMAQNNIHGMTYTPKWGFGFAFQKYYFNDLFKNDDLLGFSWGWQIQTNRVDELRIRQVTKAEAINTQRYNQAYHSAFFKAEYVPWNSIVQPYFGAGAHLGFLANPKFSLTYFPEDNFYTTINFKNSFWGWCNPALSANAGLRVIMGSKVSLGINYEFFLRNVWVSRIDILAEPVTDQFEEGNFYQKMGQFGLMSRVDLKLALLIN